MERERGELDCSLARIPLPLLPCYSRLVAGGVRTPHLAEYRVVTEDPTPEMEGNTAKAKHMVRYRGCAVSLSDPVSNGVDPPCTILHEQADIRWTLSIYTSNF